VCLYIWVPASPGSAEIKSLHHHYIFENINRNKWQWRRHPMEFDRENGGKVIWTFFSVFILIRLLYKLGVLFILSVGLILFFFLFSFQTTFIGWSRHASRYKYILHILHVRIYIYSASCNYHTSGGNAQNREFSLLLRRSTCFGNISRLPVDLYLLPYPVLSGIILKCRSFRVYNGHIARGPSPLHVVLYRWL